MKLNINNKKIIHTFGHWHLLLNDLGITIKWCKLWPRGFKSCEWLALFAKLGLVWWTCLGRGVPLPGSLPFMILLLHPAFKWLLGVFRPMYKHWLLLPHSCISLLFSYQNLPADYQGWKRKCICWRLAVHQVTRFNTDEFDTVLAHGGQHWQEERNILIPILLWFYYCIHMYLKAYNIHYIPI